MNPPLHTAILAGAFAVAALPAVAQTYTATKYRFPANFAANGTIGLTRGGTIFGSFDDASKDKYLFSKVAGHALKMHDLGSTGAVLSLAANDAGELAGTLNYPTPGAFILKGGKAHTLRLPAAFMIVNGLDDAGEVLLLGTNGGSNSFGLLRYEAAHVTRYDVPGGVQTSPLATNNKFAVVGYYAIKGDNSQLEGFLYQNGITTTITGPGQSAAFPIAIDDSGTMALVHNGSNYLFDGSTYTTIAVPNATRTTLKGLNNAGAAFGIYTDASNVTHGFVYKNGAYTNIDAPAGREMASLLGMDDAGDVVGEWWKGPPYEQVAFIAKCSGAGC